MSILRKDVNKILKKIKQGDEESKNTLFETTYNHLKRRIYPYVRNKDDLEDVLVEGYLRANRYVASFDPKQDGYNWLCKIMENVAYDWDQEYFEEVSLSEVDLSDSVIDLEEMIATKDEVERWLQEYSARDQRMMRLRFWDNMTLEEIAPQLNIKKSNVHKRISKILKEILKKERNRVEK